MFVLQVHSGRFCPLFLQSVHKSPSKKLSNIIVLRILFSLFLFKFTPALSLPQRRGFADHLHCCKVL